MRFAENLRKTIALVLVMAILLSSGCNYALGLQDWQRDIFGLAVSTGVAALTSFLFQFTTVRVERNCFENGVPIDCALLPNNGQI
jgi:hypothetical protein